jgi:hypothetical protein
MKTEGNEGKEDGAMRRLLVGLCVFGLVALTTPLVAYADGGTWETIPAPGAANTPTLVDDDTQVAIATEVGVPMDEVVMPTRLPYIAADAAFGAAFVTIAE